jgi:hypothetical protein
MGDSKGRFPAPYIQDVKANDPMMKRVDQEHLEIGARASGMPKNVKSEGLSIHHVGEAAKGSK